MFLEFVKSYEFPTSLWALITDAVAPNEIDEMKSYLSEDLVDQSMELRSEISTLLEIYRQLDNDRAAGDIGNFLPEPPEIRNRLMKEIQFFVTSIREQAKSQGQDPECFLRGRSYDVINYATDSAFSSRPSTSDYSRISTARSCSSGGTSNSDGVNINLMKDKMNYLSFEEIQSNLKQFLQDEVNQLQEDLNFINQAICVNDPNELLNSQPTIAQLKTERHELEQILLTSRPSTSRSMVNGKTSQPSTQRSIKKPLFKLHSDSSKPPVNKSPVTKLQPIAQKQIMQTQNTPIRIESPLDLGLPETSSSLSDIIGPRIPEYERNNSSLSPTPSVCSSNYTMDQLALFSNDNNINDNNDSANDSNKTDVTKNSKVENYSRFNSAQKFRQKVLQNRKDSTMTVDKL